MINRFLLITVIFISGLFSKGSGILWEKTYGGIENDGGWFVIETQDTGFIITGYTYSFGSGGSDVYVIRTDKHGDTLWTKTFGGVNDDYAFSMKKISDGFIIAGLTLSYGAGQGDVYLIKIDFEGNKIWEKTFGDTTYETARDIEVDNDGGYILAGYRLSETNDYDIYLIRTDSIGNLIQERTYGGNQDDFGYSICKTNDGGYIIGGYTYSSPTGGSDIYVLKTDENGDTIWTRTYGRNENDFGYSIFEDVDGNYIISGSSYWALLGYELCYMKIDPRGDILWRRYNGSLSNDYAWSVQGVGDGYVITGNFSSLLWLLKTDSLGYLLLSELYGGQGYDIGHWVKQTADSAFIIVGETSSFGTGDYDVYLIKTKPYVKIEENNSEEFPSSKLEASYKKGNIFIKYFLREEGNIRLVLYNLLGQKIKILKSGYEESGAHISQLRVASFPKGVYIIELVTEKMKIHKKILLLY